MSKRRPREIFLRLTYQELVARCPIQCRIAFSDLVRRRGINSFVTGTLQATPTKEGVQLSHPAFASAQGSILVPAKHLDNMIDNSLMRVKVSKEPSPPTAFESKNVAPSLGTKPIHVDKPKGPFNEIDNVLRVRFRRIVVETLGAVCVKHGLGTSKRRTT